MMAVTLQAFFSLNSKWWEVFAYFHVLVHFLTEPKKENGKNLHAFRVFENSYDSCLKSYDVNSTVQYMYKTALHKLLHVHIYMQS